MSFIKHKEKHISRATKFADTYVGEGELYSDGWF